MRTVYVQVHNPKSGGTTFHNIMRHNLGGGHFRYDSQLVPRQDGSAEAFGALLDHYPWLAGYSSHRFSLDLPYDRPDTRIVAITFVRDPVERFLSHYHFNRTGRGALDLQAKEWPLSDYITRVLEEKIPPNHDNAHTRFRLSQLDFLAGNRSLAALDQVQSLLERGDLLAFPLERFDEACLVLEKRFADDFSDCSYVPRNVVKKTDKQASESDRQRIRAHLPESDFKLHGLVHTWLDQALEGAFPGGEGLEGALQGFRERCQRKWAWEKSPALSWRLRRIWACLQS
ncbi:MAG: sulfotransferase family 2 domain-containing protein [Magnetococcales bacterium]|nr:sulfotransferase family 2 domain-containing protein [Magnetococcales bacterium]